LDDLRHPVPNLGVMLAAPALQIEEAPMVVPLTSVAVEIAEFLQFLVVFFLDRFYLRERGDVIVRRN